MSKTTVTIKSNFKAVKGAVTGDMLEKAALAVAHYIEAQAKINIERTFSRKSVGNLANSFAVETAQKTETRVMVDVGPTAIYGRIQELGGIIKPVTARMLSWIGDDGQRIFAKMVQIPARPYLRPAVDEHMTRIKWLITYTLNRQIEKAAKQTPETKKL